MYDTIFQYKKLRGKLSFVQCQLCFNHSFMCFSDVTPYFALHKDPVRQLFSTTGNSSPPPPPSTRRHQNMSEVIFFVVITEGERVVDTTGI